MSKLVLFIIFNNLDSITALGMCQRVCKRWKETIDQNEALWKQLASRIFGESLVEGAKELLPWSWKEISKTFTRIDVQMLEDIGKKKINLKSIFLGEGGVGKSSLINVKHVLDSFSFVSPLISKLLVQSFIFEKFQEYSTTTTVASFLTKKVHQVNGSSIVLNLWVIKKKDF